jgi:hypothetical protein
LLSCRFFSVTFVCHLQNSTQFYSFSTTVLYAVYSASTRLLLSCRTLLVTTLHGLTENTVFYCQECVLTGALPSNEYPPSIVACACVAGMCLPTRCLAMGIHVIVCSPSCQITYSTKLHGVIFQMTVIFILTVLRTSKQMYCLRGQDQINQYYSYMNWARSVN